MEQQPERGMEVRPDVEIMVIPDVEWRDNAVIFHKQLDDQRREQLFGGLNRFKDGYQFFYADSWRQVEIEGGEWTDWIPDSIALGTAQTWRKVGDMFMPIVGRVYNHKAIKFSHYAATRKLELHEAHKILEAAAAGEWPEKAVREAVKLVLGTPKKEKKPKILVCKHCGRPAFEDIPCEGCMHDVAEVRIQALRKVLEAIRDNDINDVGQALRFTVDVAIKALEGI